MAPEEKRTTLTQIKQELSNELRSIIKDDIIKNLMNGFRKEVIKEVKSTIDGEIKIQMAKAWDNLSINIEGKITHATMELKQDFKHFQQDAAGKLENYSAILRGINELTGDMKRLQSQRETCLQHFARLQTKANGWEQDIPRLKDRVNDLEDRPGKIVLRSRDKIRYVTISGVIGALAAGGPFLVRWIVSLIQNLP